MLLSSVEVRGLMDIVDFGPRPCFSQAWWSHSGPFTGGELPHEPLTREALADSPSVGIAIRESEEGNFITRYHKRNRNK